MERIGGSESNSFPLHFHQLKSKDRKYTIERYIPRQSVPELQTTRWIWNSCIKAIGSLWKLSQSHQPFSSEHKELDKNNGSESVVYSSRIIRGDFGPTPKRRILERNAHGRHGRGDEIRLCGRFWPHRLHQVQGHVLIRQHLQERHLSGKESKFLLRFH